MTSFADHFIQPNWPAPTSVKAVQTTRLGGVSQNQYASLNLGTHVKDKPLYVAQNRQLLSNLVPSEPVWLNQVHGTQVVDAASASCVPEADASFTHRQQTVCAVMTADCLPILLCNTSGTVVAAVHAGWRGLCDGVIEATVKAMGAECANLMAWLGPAIGPDAFEVGDEVRKQFIAHDADAEAAFKSKQDKWLGNLYLLAKQRLEALGVQGVYGEPLCTYSTPEQFFSYRRDGETGRMATMIWLSA